MAEVIRMPLLSDTMTEGKIVKWNKKVGDKVKADDSLADVETDKATMDVVGYADGTLLYVGVPEGSAAKVNDIIAIVGKDGEDIKSLLDSTRRCCPRRFCTCANGCTRRHCRSGPSCICCTNRYS